MEIGGFGVGNRKKILLKIGNGDVDGENFGLRGWGVPYSGAVYIPSLSKFIYADVCLFSSG